VFVVEEVCAIVGAGIRAVPNNCPGPQLEISRLRDKTTITIGFGSVFMIFPFPRR
jgi:hypothetical protein